MPSFMLSLIFAGAAAATSSLLQDNSFVPASRFAGHNNTQVPRAGHDVLNRLFNRQLTCDAGYGLCRNGRCCPLSEDCCLEAPLCVEVGGACCHTYTCPSGWTCCAGRCSPNDAQCCATGYYCPNGWLCVWYSGQQYCCIGLGCNVPTITAVSLQAPTNNAGGVSTSTPSPTGGPAASSTSVVSPASTTELPAAATTTVYMYYTFTVTWSYTSYYYTGTADWEYTWLTDVDSTVVSFYCSEYEDARSSASRYSATEDFPTPTNATLPSTNSLATAAATATKIESSAIGGTGSGSGGDGLRSSAPSLWRSYTPWSVVELHDFGGEHKEPLMLPEARSLAQVACQAEAAQLSAIGIRVNDSGQPRGFDCIFSSISFGYFMATTVDFFKYLFERLIPQPPQAMLDQEQSPLFSVFPAEIRNRIFQIALTASPDPENQYNPADWFFRPGFSAYPRVSTTLLRTCRRVYSETRYFPISANDHVFWYRSDRAPAKLKHATDTVQYFQVLTPAERANVKSVHWFCQQLAMETGSYACPVQVFKILPNPDFRPEKMKLTIRHTDWFWESRVPLKFAPIDEPNWAEQFLHVPGLQVFQLELEIIEERKSELVPIVARLLQWKISLGNGKWLVAKNRVDVWTWMGPDSYGGTPVNGHSSYEARLLANQRKKNESEWLSNTPYVVQCITWNARELS